MAWGKDQEIAELRQLVEELNRQTSRNEQEKQNMRIIRGRLDNQIDIFNRIYHFSQQAFHATSLAELNHLIPDGVVDIFQLEIGALLLLDASVENFLLLGSCNLESEQTAFPVSREWLARPGLARSEQQMAFVETPTADSPFAELQLAHAIYTPLFDNHRQLLGLILGGISRSGADFYDFTPKELLSSFTVYCQQMNGIYNNFSAVAEAKSAGQAKTHFLANLSHEIRTPMNAISGMVQIANRSQDFAEVKKCLTQIDISSHHLLGLLNDVLDISKIEEGKLSLNQEPFILDAIIDNIGSSMRQSALDKQVRLTVDTQKMHALSVAGDAMRLSQVLINLLSNAIKFTPAGGEVTLQVEELSRDQEKALVKFAVADNGIGMSEDILARIFSPFEQADSSTSRKYGGTGLGLTISQRIVALMDSEIKVQSQPDQGSTFSFSVWFPLAEANGFAPESRLAAGQPVDFSGRTILVVDDIAINREIIKSFLADTGVNCEEAADGQEAVERFSASPPGYYDLILMDVQMPVLDGCAATRAIRALARPDAQTTTILAMTANVFKEDMRQVVEAGMNGHIGKPVEYESTLAMIQQAFLKNSE